MDTLSSDLLNLIDKVLDLQGAIILNINEFVESEYQNNILLYSHHFIEALRTNNRYWIDKHREQISNLNPTSQGLIRSIYKSIKYNQDWFAQKNINKVRIDIIVFIYGKCLKYAKWDWCSKLEQEIKDNKTFILEHIKGYFYYIHKIKPSQNLLSNEIFLSSYLTSSLFTMNNGVPQFASGLDMKFFQSKFDVDVLKAVATNTNIIEYMTINSSKFVAAVLHIAHLYYKEIQHSPFKDDNNEAHIINSLLSIPYNQIDVQVAQNITTQIQNNHNHVPILKFVFKLSKYTRAIKNLIQSILSNHNIDIEKTLNRFLATFIVVRNMYESTQSPFEEAVFRYSRMSEHELIALQPAINKWQALSLLIESL